MFEHWYYTSTLNALKNLPKEIVYSAAAVIAVTEVHKRHATQKTREAEINAKVRMAELEVEKLSLQLEMHNARANNPLT